jgi:hypothetical protein
MNNTETVKVLGKDYPKKNIKYSYTGKKMRYKKHIKYLGIFFLLVWLIGVYLSQQFRSLLLSLALSHTLSTSPHNETLENLEIMLHIIRFIEISLIVAFIILLIPRINCLFLKIDGNKKDIILFKSPHKNEVSLISDELNAKIKEKTFNSFPY